MRELTDFNFSQDGSSANLAKLPADNIEGDDTENTFDNSWSESNVETADPEEFDVLRVCDARTHTEMDSVEEQAQWGSVLIPTASGSFSQSFPQTDGDGLDLDASIHLESPADGAKTGATQAAPCCVAEPKPPPKGALSSKQLKNKLRLRQAYLIQSSLDKQVDVCANSRNQEESSQEVPSSPALPKE